MPIFEYQCNKCELKQDKLVSRKDVDEDKTFECNCENKGTMTRSEVVNAATLRFKGNWFGTTGRY